MSLKASIEAASAKSRQMAADKNKNPCLDCKHYPELQAVILFPSLGTPFITHTSEENIRLFLLAEDKCLGLFGVSKTGEAAQPLGANQVNRDTPPLAWYFMNRHLRLTPFEKDQKTSADLKGGGLYTSQDAAKKAITVQYLGEYGGHEPPKQATQGRWYSGAIADSEGNLLGAMRASAVEFFVNAKAAYGSLVPAFPLSPPKADVTNKPLRHLFQIDLSTTGLTQKPAANTCYSLSWMVTCVYQDAQRDDLKGEDAKNLGRNNAFLSPVTHWEHQDKLIFDFLYMMRKNKQHFWEPFAFDVDAVVNTHGDLKAAQIKTEARRLKAYHPVMFSTKPELHIGHVTDVHINSRIFGLNKSRAEVVPGMSEPIGPKACNTFSALKELFDRMRSHKADAIFLTGDLIDFNHNLDPTWVPDGDPKDQWALFDLNAHFDYQGLQLKEGHAYPRGIDDILAYSLVVHSCAKHCPVFMTTGNHEAYDVPYGVSPRGNLVTVELAYRQAERQNRRRRTAAAARRKERTPGANSASAAADPEDSVIPATVSATVSATLSAAVSATVSGVESVAKISRGVVAAAARVVPGHSEDATPEKDNKAKPFQSDPNSTGVMRVNAGIPADHNLSIYEACLAYGPSFATVLKPWNFMPANFDWFFMIFTPLSDFQIRYNQRQCLIGLDWGETEIMVNADILGEKAAAERNDNDLSTLAGNLFGLPRADKSLSEVQRNLIRNALAITKKEGGKNILFCHFTLVNFDQPVSMSEGRAVTRLSDGWFDHFNRGTFSLHRKWLFDLIRGNELGKLHYTLSGHSHRTGAYSLRFLPAGEREDWFVNPWDLNLVGYEPAEPQDATTQSRHKDVFPVPCTGLTRVLVSSCGGPIGWQNHCGELNGMNLKPPSGTLLKTDATGPDEFRRICTQTRHAQPRFCVALDFLWIDSGKPVITWAKEEGARPNNPDVMYVRGIKDPKPFIDKVDFFVVQPNGKSKGFATTLELIDLSRRQPRGTAATPDTLAYRMTVQDFWGLKTLVSAPSETDSSNGKKLLPKLFARISFNKALVSHPLYAHYQFDPWFFPVTLREGWQFFRSVGGEGEVPDFEWLKSNPLYKYKSPSPNL